MTRRADIPRQVKRQLERLTPAHRREAIEALQAVINAELLNDATYRFEPICCRQCGSVAIKKNGHDIYNAQRYRCNDCGHTFTSSTGTILGTTKLSKDKWMKFVTCFIDRKSLRQCQVEVGVCLKTAFFMRHRVLECIYKVLPSFQVESGCAAELDETFFRENFKGNHTKSGFELPREARHHGAKLHTRGISNEQICVMTGVNDYGDIFYELACRGRINVSTAENVLSDKIKSGALISTDTNHAYKKALSSLGVACHNAYNSKNTTDGSINRINNLHSRLKEFIKPFRGVSTKHLRSYLAWFKWMYSFDQKDGTLRDIAARQIANGTYDTHWRDYKNKQFPFMEYWVA